MEPFWCQIVSKVFDVHDVELAFLRFHKEPMLLEMSEYFTNMFLMLGVIIRVNKDVVKIDNNTDIQQILENVIHEVSEC